MILHYDVDLRAAESTDILKTETFKLAYTITDIFIHIFSVVMCQNVLFLHIFVTLLSTICSVILQIVLPLIFLLSCYQLVRYYTNNHGLIESSHMKVNKKLKILAACSQKVGLFLETLFDKPWHMFFLPVQCFSSYMGANKTLNIVLKYHRVGFLGLGSVLCLSGFL